MSLSSIRSGDSFVVKGIGGSKIFKLRLASMGIMRGARLDVKETSLAKQVIKLIVDGSSIVAVRLEEAKNIQGDRA